MLLQAQNKPLISLRGCIRYYYMEDHGAQEVHEGLNTEPTPKLGRKQFLEELLSAYINIPESKHTLCLAHITSTIGNVC